MHDRSAGKAGLFADYINLFLKLKQKASGFPREYQTEQQKLDYIAKDALNDTNLIMMLLKETLDYEIWQKYA